MLCVKPDQGEQGDWDKSEHQDSNLPLVKVLWVSLLIFRGRETVQVPYLLWIRWTSIVPRMGFEIELALCERGCSCLCLWVWALVCTMRFVWCSKSLESWFLPFCHALPETLQSRTLTSLEEHCDGGCSHSVTSFYVDSGGSNSDSTFVQHICLLIKPPSQPL